MDFILDEDWAIEVKAKTTLSSGDFKGMLALKEEGLCSRYSIVYLGEHRQKYENGVEALPYFEFIKEVYKDLHL
ncbi:MAG: hypothetical protein V4591_05015 [Bdellovibrionota bacterium]